MAENKFIYGIGAVRFQDNIIGYIEKGSWDWGGYKPQVTDIEAEQVPDAPVLSLVDEDGGISPTFNLIQLDYGSLKQVLGGNIVFSSSGYAITGWQAPTELLSLTGEFDILFLSGQQVTIPSATLVANLGGKLTLTEVSKVECQLKIDKPEDGSAAYEIGPAQVPAVIKAVLQSGQVIKTIVSSSKGEEGAAYAGDALYFTRGLYVEGRLFLSDTQTSAPFYSFTPAAYGDERNVSYYPAAAPTVLYAESEELKIESGGWRGEEIAKDRASGGDWHRTLANTIISTGLCIEDFHIQGNEYKKITIQVAGRNMGSASNSLQAVLYKRYGNGVGDVVSVAEATWSNVENDIKILEFTGVPPEYDVTDAIIGIMNPQGDTNDVCIDYIIVTAE